MIEIEKKETEQKVAEVVRGERGNIGTPTAALTLKQLYHAAHFDRVDAEDKRNPNKKVWNRHPGAPSLKQYARSLKLKGDPTAKDWLDHKNGTMNQSRSDKNIADTKAIGAATKMSRSKTKK